MVKMDPDYLSLDQRKEILNREIYNSGQAGWTVQSLSNTQAVIVRNKKIGWFWNTILVLITSGLWLIPVAYWVINRKQETRLITVNDEGMVFWS
jgi:hypothetical protein